MLSKYFPRAGLNMGTLIVDIGDWEKKYSSLNFKSVSSSKPRLGLFAAANSRSISKFRARIEENGKIAQWLTSSKSSVIWFKLCFNVIKDIVDLSAVMQEIAETKTQKLWFRGDSKFEHSNNWHFSYKSTKGTSIFK